jgi:hypothetical protein
MSDILLQAFKIFFLIFGLIFSFLEVVEVTKFVPVAVSNSLYDGNG